MKIVYSPCPNDTFIFHALVHGLIPNVPAFDVTYADIDVTNSLAASTNGPDILKISYAALPWADRSYALLPCGGALGRGCGPLLLTKDPLRADDLAGKKVAVPSERSTAYLLFRLWAAQQVPGGVGEIIVMPFHEIMPAVRDGKIDAGLVIHEARFTYQNYHLSLMTDLGNWWEQDTGLPIPLGAILAKRSLPLEKLTALIRASVQYAWANPDASREYVASLAQEMSPEVTKAHIDLYVNSFSADLGENGFQAVSALLSRASKEGLIPQINTDALRWW